MARTPIKAEQRLRAVFCKSMVRSNTVTVTGGILEGTGTIGSPGYTTTVTGGIVKPGDSPGILTNLGNYNQSGGGFQVDIIGQGNVPRVNNGELVVDGSTTLGTGAEIIVNSEDGSFYIGGAYTIIDSVGSLQAHFHQQLSRIQRLFRSQSTNQMQSSGLQTCILRMRIRRNRGECCVATLYDHQSECRRNDPSGHNHLSRMP